MTPKTENKRTEQVATVVTRETMWRITEAAKREQRSVAAWIRLLIEKELEAQQ